MNRLIELHQHMVADGSKNFTERLLFLLLLPLSLSYGVVGWARNVCYDYKLLSSYQSSLPVISVGNIAVGGTGKTPVVDWLVKEFIKHGKFPAVVSRGYSGAFRGDVGIVSATDGLLMSAAECGDEPYLLAKRNPRCFVVVARKRSLGVKAVEASGGADVVILDDGFQHRAVKRDFDLVLLDSTRPLGNGWVLPAGILREFPQSLHRADLLLMTRSGEQRALDFMELQVYNSDHELSEIAVTLAGEEVPVGQLKGLNLLAFSGIAHPEFFFEALVNSGLTVKNRLAFGDHVKYDKPILDQVYAVLADVDALITTEKDGVKLTAEMFEKPCYQLPMDVKIDNSKELFDVLTKRLWSE